MVGQRLVAFTHTNPSKNSALVDELLSDILNRPSITLLDMHDYAPSEQDESTPERIEAIQKEKVPVRLVEVMMGVAVIGLIVALGFLMVG